MSTVLIKPAAWTPSLCGVAAHEGGHFFGAKRLGLEVRECWVLPNGRGYTLWRTPENPFDGAMIALFGPAAHHQFYGRDSNKTLFDFASPADREIFESAARDAERSEYHQAKFLLEAAAETRRLVRREWPSIKGVARQIVAAGGVFLTHRS